MEEGLDFWVKVDILLLLYTLKKISYLLILKSFKANFASFCYVIYIYEHVLVANINEICRYFGFIFNATIYCTISFAAIILSSKTQIAHCV